MARLLKLPSLDFTLLWSVFIPYQVHWVYSFEVRG